MLNRFILTALAAAALSACAQDGAYNARQDESYNIRAPGADESNATTRGYTTVDRETTTSPIVDDRR